MARFERRNDAFQPRAELERGERLVIGAGQIFRATRVAKKRVLRADTRIVETSRNRVRINDLAIIGLQQVGLVAMQDTGPPAIEGGRMLAGFNAVSGRLNTDEANVFVLQEGMDACCLEILCPPLRAWVKHRSTGQFALSHRLVWSRHRDCHEPQ